ncbi:hypothetical protein GALMADRAFT_233586 [Galerina marginata CBS 339.88]|uniref:Uncharacterized protein n=1 Tax=Galerina marginata (strain CBS 339.88) TaxID=685588 RepID=A0A067TYG7_GALM3|nr:hypothetical protein GALMADRAFT_233586 [Galerina marginata CBS 339.88]
MAAISPATVHVVLDYLCPLAGPIPPHLISRPLLQRHHFLALSPDNAAEYLAWPSPEQSHAVHLLQSEPIPTHDLPFPVHYLPDPESIQAHVRITPALRLVFLWDKNHGWLYHNVALMPFPANSYSSFDDALAACSPEDFLPEQSHHFTVQGDDDDSYWNAYGQGDVPDHNSSSGYLDPNPSSEDAYWAQYATVQGSGDSTLPSPRLSKKKLPAEGEQDNDIPERIIVPSDDLQTNHAELYNPLEPPPPASLARRLEALAAESGTNSPPLFDDYPTRDSNTASPQALEAMPALTSSSSTASPPQPLSDGFIVDQVSNHATQDALRDNIKSLFQLWKLARPDKSINEDKEFFLNTVRQALEQL